MAQQVPALRPGRRIEGISALLLPYTSEGRPDLDAHSNLVEQTFAAGLTPAVNMDTGFVNLLTREERSRVLGARRRRPPGSQGSSRARSSKARRARRWRSTGARSRRIRAAGATPILFPSSALAGLDEDALLGVFREVARGGRAHPRLRARARCSLASDASSHSTCSHAPRRSRFRRPQALLAGPRARSGSGWRLRDSTRPDFKRLHRERPGHRHGLLRERLSPRPLGVLARGVRRARPALGRLRRARAVALNDLLQYLGFLAFRAPVPGLQALGRPVPPRGAGSPRPAHPRHRGAPTRTWRSSRRRDRLDVGAVMERSREPGGRCQPRAARPRPSAPISRRRHHAAVRRAAGVAHGRSPGPGRRTACQRRQPILRAPDGGLGGAVEGEPHRADPPTLAPFRAERCEADLGWRGGRRAPRRARQPEPAAPDRSNRLVHRATAPRPRGRSRRQLRHVQRSARRPAAHCTRAASPDPIPTTGPSPSSPIAIPSSTGVSREACGSSPTTTSIASSTTS